MGSPEPTIPTEIRNHGSCDESKCVSRGNSHLYGGAFTCYGDDGTFYPMMCADGFLPVVVENEPALSATVGYDYPLMYMPVYGTEFNVPVKYFTCCPPDHSPDHASNATRHCSDPITNSTKFEAGDDPVADALCLDQDTRKYPRRMKPRWLGLGLGSISRLICCDSDDDKENNATVTRNFLDESECVPYRNDNYAAALIPPNQWGRAGGLTLISCDFSGQDNFPFPRPIGEDVSKNNSTTLSEGQLRYQCCRNGPGMAPFVSDSAFKMTVYPFIAIYAITAILSFIVGLALLIPLLIQLKDGSYRRATGRRNGKPEYSTYNLYLVYIAFLDLFYALSYLVIFSGMANQKFYDSYWTQFVRIMDPGLVHLEARINTSYSISNVWINAIIVYEIFILLRSSKRVQRVKPPSLKRVNMQCAATILFSALLPVTFYCLWRFQLLVVLGYTFWFSFVIICIPIIYGIWVSILIMRRGYIPSANGSTPRDKAVRGLAFFFFRITVTFTVLYLPTFLFGAVMLAGKVEWWGGVFVLTIVWGLQPMFTFFMILTKPDVKLYIMDFVTLKYIFGDCTCTCERKAEPVGGVEGTPSNGQSRMDSTVRSSTNETSRTDSAHPVTKKQMARHKSVSILGYTFLDVDDDSNMQVEADADVEQNVNITSTDAIGDCVAIDSMVEDDDQGDANDTDDNDSVGNANDETNVETKVGKYESRRVRGGPASVLATGKTVLSQI